MKTTYDLKDVGLGLGVALAIIVFGLAIIVALTPQSHALVASSGGPAVVVAPTAAAPASDKEREQVGWDQCKANGYTHNLAHGDSENVFLANDIVNGVYPDPVAQDAEGLGCSEYLFGESRP